MLVDMEDGVVSETMRGPLGELFDAKQVSVLDLEEIAAFSHPSSFQVVTDVSGAGNNWAQG